MNSPALPNILFFPPMWWDRRAVKSCASTLPTLSFVDVNIEHTDASLLAVAERFVHSCSELRLDQPFVVAAYGESTSLALEVVRLWISSAATAQLKSLLLICGGRTSSAISVAFRRGMFFDTNMPWLPSLFRTGGLLREEIAAADLNDDTKRLVNSMLTDADRKRWRRYIKLLHRWECSRTEADRIDVPIHQLNGRQDKLFVTPLPCDATLVGKANHLLWFKQPELVVNWVDAMLRA